MEYTHPMLVNKASQWLAKRGCCPVLEEFAGHGQEIPDVIGWLDGQSTLIEVKVSRADFMADRAKKFRSDSMAGMGRLRYFMVPEGVIDVVDLMTNEVLQLWGLLVFDGRSVKVCKEATVQSYSHLDELKILAAGLRRLQRRISPMNLREFFRAQPGSPLDPLYVVRRMPAPETPLYRLKNKEESPRLGHRRNHD